MHYSRHYLQGLEKSVRQSLRLVAVDEAKRDRSNETRVVNAVDFGSKPRRQQGKNYQMGS